MQTEFCQSASSSQKPQFVRITILNLTVGGEVAFSLIFADYREIASIIFRCWLAISGEREKSFTLRRRFKGKNKGKQNPHRCQERIPRFFGSARPVQRGSGEIGIPRRFSPFWRSKWQALSCFHEGRNLPKVKFCFCVKAKMIWLLNIRFVICQSLQASANIK